MDFKSSQFGSTILASSIFSTELTADTFARLLAWFHEDVDKAAEIYESMRFRLGAFFQARQCLFADDLVDTVFDRVARKLEHGEFENKKAYMYGVARNVYLEYVRKEPWKNELDETRVSDATPHDDAFDIDETQTKLDGCLDELAGEERDLVLQYMSGNGTDKIKNRAAMTKTYGTSVQALRMRVVRIKRRLRRCLEKCAA